jgi:hypothetical protein
MRNMRHGDPHTVLRIHKANGTSHAVRETQKKKCGISWCENNYYAKGCCVNHYFRLWKYGDPEGGYWYMVKGRKVPVKQIMEVLGSGD